MSNVILTIIAISMGFFLSDRTLEKTIMLSKWEFTHVDIYRSLWLATTVAIISAVIIFLMRYQRIIEASRPYQFVEWLISQIKKLGYKLLIRN